MTPEQLEKLEQVKQALIKILRLHKVSFYQPHYIDNEEYKVVMESDLLKMSCSFSSYIFNELSAKDIVKMCVDGYTRDAMKVL